jgi:RNA polymerase sporulation-specific sigma factor
VYIARRFENTGINLEDLISFGTIGLIKAIGTFKPAKNIKRPPMPPAASKTRS